VAVIEAACTDCPAMNELEARSWWRELVDAAHRADLRELRGDLRVVHRIERILVLHLRDEQFRKRSSMSAALAVDVELAFALVAPVELAALNASVMVLMWCPSVMSDWVIGDWFYSITVCSIT